MLSGPSNPYPSRDEKTDNCAAAEATEAILTPINENMSPTYSAPIPAGQEARNEFDTINLIYDLNEIKVAKANHLRFSAPRSAPPPPYRAIVLKSKSAMRFLDILHQAVDESKNIEMADVNGLKEGWYTTIQWSLRKMGKAGLASLRMLTLTTGPELEAPECVAFERSECHECTVFHPIDIGDSGWESHDPNVCRCCNHDRCGICWDSDENNWRIQFRDGNPLGLRNID